MLVVDMTGHMSDEYGFLKRLARFYFSFYLLLLLLFYIWRNDSQLVVANRMSLFKTCLLSLNQGM